jgi:hypothetical protein
VTALRDHAGRCMEAAASALGAAPAGVL